MPSAMKKLYLSEVDAEIKKHGGLKKETVTEKDIKGLPERCGSERGISFQ